jgi:hypothetical protein
MSRRFPPELPPSVNAFNRQRKAFEAWLIERGSAVKAITNPYEVSRFAGPGGECIVYSKANGTISNWANGADKAFRAFLDQTEWRAVEKVARNRKTAGLILSLAERDGWRCCYCPAVLDVCTATIEHFVPITSGGTNHLANLSLACRGCNDAAGHMPVRQKLEMAITRRIAA